MFYPLNHNVKHTLNTKMKMWTFVGGRNHEPQGKHHRTNPHGHKRPRSLIPTNPLHCRHHAKAPNSASRPPHPEPLAMHAHSPYTDTPPLQTPRTTTTRAICQKQPTNSNKPRLMTRLILFFVNDHNLLVLHVTCVRMNQSQTHSRIYIQSSTKKSTH
jgi:hypothetical protein